MPQDQVISVFCAFTREWLIDQWIEDFERSIKFANKSLIHLNFIVDFDSPLVAMKLRQMEDRATYGSLQLEMNRDNNPNEVNIPERRKRIAFIKNQSKAMIAKNNSSLVLSLEDDGHFEFESWYRLVRGFMEAENVGMVSGVECGRWNWKYVGAWEFDNPLAPTKCWTVLPKTDGYQEVDAAGFYAYMTLTKLYLAHDYEWERPQPWGADVNYGLWLRSQGYKVFIDWKTPIDHNHHNNMIRVFDESKLQSVCYSKHKEHDAWYRNDEESPAIKNAVSA